MRGTHYRFMIVFRLLFIMAALGFSIAQADTKGMERAWQPADSVAVKYYLPVRSYRATDGTPVESDVAPSPDGKYFYCLTKRGDLATDSIVYELDVYAMHDVHEWLQKSESSRGYLAPWRRVAVRTRSSDEAKPGIASPSWSDDGSAVQFLGMTAEGTLQIERLELASGDVKQLTSLRGGLSLLDDFASNGERALFTQMQPWKPQPPSYPMEAMAVRKQYDGSQILETARAFAFQFGDKSLYFGNAGAPARKLISGIDYVAGFWFSPDNHKAITAMTLKSGAPPLSYYLLDLVHARATALPWAVLGRSGPYAEDIQRVGKQHAREALRKPAAQALWSADGRKVVLTNVALAAAHTASSNKSRESVVVYNLASGQWHALEPLVSGSADRPRLVSGIGWLDGKHERLLITHQVNGQPTEGTVYDLRFVEATRSVVAASVTLPAKETATANGLTVEVKQSDNDPPRLVATGGSHEGVLTPPDPALKGIRLAHAQTVEWSDPADAGKTIKGLLTLPPDYQPGTRIPLVIQAYFYQPDKFEPDGNDTTLGAAQALAARGMAVLNYAIPLFDPGNPFKPMRNEGARAVAILDAAVDALAAKGIVDPQRVALTGFSHAGYQAYYIVTHPGKVKLAASIQADSFTGSYGRYLVDASDLGGSILQSYEAATSGTTFWQDKQDWLKYETTFNVDQVVTPVMFTLNGHGHGGGGTSDEEMYSFDARERLGAFFINHKPIEYLYFRDGSHQLQRPRERIAMMQATVDWMAFWLQGVVPADAERAKRWLALRDQQKAVLEDMAKKGVRGAPLVPLQNASVKH